MKSNIEKFKTLVSDEKSRWEEYAKWRDDNDAWLMHSAKIAIKVLSTLREKNISQKDLAEKLDVSPQQVSKILKGRENLTLETLTKLEKVLGIQLIDDKQIEPKQHKELSKTKKKVNPLQQPQSLKASNHYKKLNSANNLVSDYKTKVKKKV